MAWLAGCGRSSLDGPEFVGLPDVTLAPAPDAAPPDAPTDAPQGAPLRRRVRARRP